MNNRIIQTVIFCICLLFPNGVLADESGDEKVIVYSTSVVKRNNGNPLQIGSIEITDKSIQSIDIELTFPGEKLISHSFPNLGEKNHTVYFEFPVLTQRINVPVVVKQNGKIFFEKLVPLLPPKKWKIYDVQVSHHDLGYAGYYHMLRRDIREMGVEMAMAFARQTDNWPEESQFHWTIETSEPMIQYLSKQPKKVLDELKKRIENGQIAVGGIHNSVSTEHMGYEAMARHFYTPNRYVCDWLGIEPSKTALNTDVVGFSKALPLYAKEADIPYFMFGRNSSVKEFDKAEDEAAFYWQAPDKNSKMTLFKVWNYYSPDRFSNYDVTEVVNLSRTYEQHKNYPFDCILSEDSYDFGLPQFENVEGIKNWNANYSNPILISGTFDMYFDELNSQQNKESFKVFDKDAPNAWGDQDATDVAYANKARRLNSDLPATEKWATIASSVVKGVFPWSDIYQAYHGLISWAEHTNGAYSEGPIFSPPSAKDHTAANATYYELEQEMHRDLLRESEAFTNSARQIAIRQLKSQITTQSQNTLVLNNSLFRERSEYVQIELPEGTHLMKINDNTSGAEVMFQLLDNGKVLFFAESIPSMGYKTYSIKFGNNQAAVERKNIVSPTLENSFYKIGFDEKTGGIKSIFDKILNRELVDQESQYKVNEYYYERFETGNYQEGTTKHHPESASFELLNGPIAQTVLSKVKAEGSKHIIQKVTIYQNSNRIDFEVLLDKDPSGRTLADYRDYSPKGKEALFYCLPFNVPDFTIKHELAGGIMEPIKDQFKGSSTDFYVIQNFSDISNQEWGITLATREPNIVEYGKPRPALWGTVSDYESVMEKAVKSHFYLYLLNNMFFTNIRQTQEGKKHFSWSIRSHQADWCQGKAYQFGREVGNPITSFICHGKHKGTLPSDRFSFVEMDSEDVICTTLKPAEANGEGFIMRFVEVSGKEARVTVDAKFIDKIGHANLTNLVEVDREYPLELTGDNKLKFNIPAFGLRTIRIVPEKRPLPSIANLHAKALSDSEMELSWAVAEIGKENVAYYEIHKSKEADFVPGIKTFVTNVKETKFRDKPVLSIRGWQSNTVAPNTNYYYKVIPVGKYHNRGRVSNEVSAKTMTSGEANAKPNKVLGLASTLVSPITDHNYVGLYFYTNIEEDVDSYNIYRSTDKGFVADKSNLIYSLDVTQEIEHVTPHEFGKVIRPLKAYNRQVYVDEEVKPFTTYYYKVAAVDAAGQVGDFSRESSTESAIENIQIADGVGTSGRTEITIVNRKVRNWEVRYTLDGSLPTKQSALYVDPVAIDEDATFTASIFLPGHEEGLGTTQREVKTMKDYAITYNTSYHENWAGAGATTLIDGYRGEPYLSQRWQGFEGVNLDVIIDMKEASSISSVTVGCLQYYGSWVYIPDYIEVFVSNDGTDFSFVGRMESVKEWQRLVAKTADLTVAFPETKARYVKVFVKNIEKNPVWHTFAGGKAWLFVDEVIIN